MFSQAVRNFASKISTGVSKNKKDTAGKRLGMKKFGGEYVENNVILVRQRGFKWKPGANVHVGKDHTIHSAVSGYVKHEYSEIHKRTIVSVIPWERPVRPTIPFYQNFHPEIFPDLAKNNAPPTDYKVYQKPVAAEKAKRLDVGQVIDSN